MATTIGKRVLDGLNKQINDEMVASYTYLSMSTVFSDMGLNGCSKWARFQFNEKIKDYTKIVDFVILRAAAIRLLPVPAPKRDWRAPLHIFEEVVRLEQRISLNFSTLTDLSVGEKDYASFEFLEFFVKKQAENDALATYLLDRIRKMQSTDIGVLMFDKELGERPEDNPLTVIP